MTGSLYGVRNIYSKMVDNGEWFTHARAGGGASGSACGSATCRRSTASSPKNAYRAQGPQRAACCQRGTLALQGHDPDSRVEFRRIEPYAAGRSARWMAAATSVAGYGLHDKSSTVPRPIHSGDRLPRPSPRRHDGREGDGPPGGHRDQRRRAAKLRPGLADRDRRPAPRVPRQCPRTGRSSSGFRSTTAAGTRSIRPSCWQAARLTCLATR